MIEVKTHVNSFKGSKRHTDLGDHYYTPVVDGREYNYVAETEDMALLLALGIKYDGINTKFPTMAARMLKIDSEWAR